MRLKFMLELPYWIDIENYFNVCYNLDNQRKVEIKILQDLWRIRGVGPDIKKEVILHEFSVIDKYSLDFKDEISNLNDYFCTKYYSPQKMNTVIQLLYNDSKTTDDFPRYFCDNVRPRFLEEINRFLRIYSNIKLNSDYRATHIAPMNEEFLNPKNTRINKWDENVEKWIPLEISPNLDKKIDINFPSVIIEDKALFYLKEKLEGGSDINSEDKILERINYSEQIYDMASYILHLTILLESKIDPFLERLKNWHPSEIKSFLKVEGLRIFVNYQLPHFLQEQFENLVSFQIEYGALIESAQKLVKMRNEIIHRKANFKWNNALRNHCKNVRVLIHKLDVILGSPRTKWSVKESRSIGFALTKAEPGEMVQIQLFESRLQQIFTMYHFLLFDENLINFIKEKLSKDLDRFREFFIGDIIEGKDFLRLFQNDIITKIFLIPHFEFGFTKRMLRKVISHILEFEETVKNMEIIIIYSGYPINRLNKLLKFIDKLIEDVEDRIKIKRKGPYIILRKPITKEIFDQFKKSDNNKLLATTFLKDLGNKEFEDNHDIFELLFQNIITVKIEEGKKFYQLRSQFLNIGEEKLK